MKRLELDISCCKDCPYFHSEKRLYGDQHKCHHSLLNVELNHSLVGIDAEKEIHKDCPLEDKKERGVWGSHHIQSSFTCPKCGSKSTIHEDVGIYCLECQCIFNL